MSFLIRVTHHKSDSLDKKQTKNGETTRNGSSKTGPTICDYDVTTSTPSRDFSFSEVKSPSLGQNKTFCQKYTRDKLLHRLFWII